MADSFKVYSHISSGTVIMPNGKVLQFVSGVFETSDPEEIAYLQDVQKNAPSNLFLEPVHVHQSDAHVLREVGKGTGGGSGTGAVNSSVLAALAAASKK